MELRTSCLDNEEFFKYQKSINILMHTILSPVTLCHKLITEEWKQLFALMDILYGNALKIWLAIFFGISLQSLSKRKQRLRAKLKIPHGMSFKDVVNAI